MLAGKIISVSDLLVEVLLSGVQVKKRDMMYAERFQDGTFRRRRSR